MICPNSFFKNWVIKHFGDVIRGEIKKVAGKSYDFKIRISDESSNKKNKSDSKKKNKTKKAPPKKKQMTLPKVKVNKTEGVLLRDHFTFDNFVVGKCNRFAHAAAMSLASENEINENNLCIVSKTGLGKSHLSQAIGHKILREKPGIRVYYVTAENFANEMVQSLQNKTINNFKNKYRNMCDVLILDDVHFLSGKSHTQEELSYTLDSLQESEKKIIFTSSYNPGEIPKLHENFESRLYSSLITQMEAPDYKTRFQILQRKALCKGYNLPEEVNHYLAAELLKNVRQLESGLMGVLARASLLKVPMDIFLAESVVKNIKKKQKLITIDYIKKLICNYYKLSHEDIISKSRKKAIVLPRQIAMFLCRRYTEEPLQAIAKCFRKHHATAFHSINAIEKKIKEQSTVKNQIDYLCNKLDEE